MLEKFKYKNKISLHLKENLHSGNFVLECPTNGLYLNKRFIPEELLINILSFISPKELLRLSLVCKRWCRIIKSSSLWMQIYQRRFKKPGKRMPWFVYYGLFVRNLLDSNLLYNHENKVISQKNWEDTYYECIKHLAVPLDRSYLLFAILERYKPSIYISESVAGVFDCGCVETLKVNLDNKEYRVQKRVGEGNVKMEILITNRPKFSRTLIFLHERCNSETDYCREHYTSYAIDGEVKVLFDTLQPRENDEFLGD